MRNARLDKSNGASRGPSEAVSRYLEAIYYMWSEGEHPRGARLADWLSVSRPTVTVALRRMTRDGIVRLNGRKEIELTPKGRRTAEAIVRRHRIMERWLTDGLGLDWVTADTEAARLEHAVSDVVEKRLFEVLGRPATCPHGNPIPGYSEPAPNEVRLTNLDPGARASITRVSEVAEREAPLLLAYLHERRLVPGREIAVLEVDGVGGTLRIRADAREVTLSHETAGKLWVIPARTKYDRPVKENAKTTGMRKRVHAARERLKTAPKSSRRGPTDPATGESWHRGNVLGHTAEMLDFWAAQFRAARAGSREIGRGEGGNQKRRHGIDRGEAAAEEELQLAVDAAVGDLLDLLDELTAEDLELEVVFHSREGDRPARIDELLEMLVIGHLEEHVEQLASLRTG